MVTSVLSGVGRLQRNVVVTSTSWGSLLPFAPYAAQRGGVWVVPLRATHGCVPAWVCATVCAHKPASATLWLRQYRHCRMYTPQNVGAGGASQIGVDYGSQSHLH